MRAGVEYDCLIAHDPTCPHVAESVAAAPSSKRAAHRSARAAHALAAAGPTARWDVVIMDLDLPGMDGVEATCRLRERLPEVAVVVLTAFDDPPRILSAIQAGADGYLLKNVDGDELITSLHQAMQGGAPMSPGVARSVLGLLRDQEPREPCPPLTPRERTVLVALVHGQAYKQVAADLDISIGTVRGYVRTLYRKLRVHSATEAVAKALREGWVE
mgnify:CR=1 FL=1